MDFISVDFETPNRRNDCICAVGLTLVKDSSVVFNRRVLINPHATFDTMNISVHGITKADVEDAPAFDAFWAEYGRYFAHYPVVTHNASFDACVLSKAAKRSKVKLPPMDFYCTMQLCSEALNVINPALPYLADHFGLSLQHHDCASDSLCTAQIMLKLSADESIGIHTRFTCEQFAEKDAHWGEPKQKSPVSLPASEKEHLPTNDDTDNIVAPDCDYSTGDIAIDGKRFVFTGALPGLDRSIASAFIEELGGRVTSSVSKKTDYVIVGMEDLAVVGADGKSSKIEKAEALIAEGHPINIVSYSQFLEFYRNSH